MPSVLGISPKKGTVASASSFSGRLLLLLLAGAFVDAGLALLGLNPSRGYLILVPFAVLSVYALAFAVALQAIGAEKVWQKVGWLIVFAERRRFIAFSALGILGFGGSLIAVWVLRGFPNSGDEYAYLFEARTFVAGRFWNSLPPLPALFENYYVYPFNGRWLATYPPGWPLMLATAMGLHLPPWVTAPLSGGALLIAAYMLGQRRDGVLGGLLAVGLIAFSPFFLFNAGSYFDNLPAAAAGLFFGLAALAFLNCPRWSNALGIGLALGVIGLIRPQDVVFFGLPFITQFCLRARREHYRFLFGVVIAGIPFLLALMFYNFHVFGLPTGAPSRYPSIRFGLFPVDEMGNHLTPFDEVLYFIARMVLLADWTSPLLIVGYFMAFFLVTARRRLEFVDFVFPTFVLGFMLIPFWGGNQYGPRYYLEGFPFLVMTITSGIVSLFKDPTLSRWRSSGALALAVHGATCLASLAIIAPFLHAVVNQRMDMYDQVNAKNLQNAVVVVRSETGTIWPMAPYDLVRNDITADGQVLYVLNLSDQVEKLHELLPERQFYVYERDPLEPKGKLRRLW